MAAAISSTELAAALKSCGHLNLSSDAVSFLDTIISECQSAIEAILGIGITQETVTEFWPGNATSALENADSLVDNWEKVGNQLITTRSFDSRGYIYLQRTPVQSITSIYENSAAWLSGESDGSWPSTTLLPATAYRLDKDSPGLSWTGRVERMFGSWLAIPRTVKVTYLGGLSECELKGKYAPVLTALRKMCAHELTSWVSRGMAAQAGGAIRSVSFEGFSASIDPSMAAASGRAMAIPKDAMYFLTPFINPAKLL